jgi:hypothetical protein
MVKQMLCVTPAGLLDRTGRQGATWKQGPDAHHRHHTGRPGQITRGAGEEGEGPGASLPLWV